MYYCDYHVNDNNILNIRKDMPPKSFDKMDNVSLRKKIEMALIPLYCSLASMVNGYFMVYFSMLESDFNKYNNLNDGSGGLYFDATLALPFGALLGSFSYNKFVKAFGQDKCMKLLDLLAILVVLPQLFTLQFHIVIILRLCMGFYCAITTALIPSWIISLAPQKLSGIFGTFSYLAIVAGMLQAYALGAQIDTSVLDRQIAVKIFIGMPIITSIAHLLGLFIFGSDSLERLIETRQQIKYTKVLRRIYGRKWARFESQIRQFKITPVQYQVNGKATNHNQNTPEKQHARILGFACQACGIFAVIEYSKQLFSIIQGDFLETDQTMILFGLCQILAVIISGFLINIFGRRKIMLFGLVSVSILLFLSSILAIFVNKNEKALVAILSIYVIVYSLSIGPLFMLYAIEALLNLQIVLTAYWGTTVILTISTELFLSYIDFSVLLNIFFACSSIAFIFFNRKMIETKGVPKKNIKEMMNEKDFIWESSDILFQERIRQQTQVQKSLGTI